jgi:hypothetical protein
MLLDNKNYMKEKTLLAKMDKKLYEQLRRYSFHQNQSIAETARQAIDKFINEQKQICTQNKTSEEDY